MKSEDIRKLLVDDYKDKVKAQEIDGELYISGRKGWLKPLDDYFKNYSMLSITTEVLREFKEARKKSDGVSGPTVNRNFAALRRMFRLAQKQGRLMHVPYFPMDAESDARQGFVEPAKFIKRRAAMPAGLRPTLQFLYDTGSRFGVCDQVKWEWVSLGQRTIEIPEGVTKTGKPITLPLSTELIKMLKRAPKDAPPFPTTNWRKEWIAACVKVGLGVKTGEQWYKYAGLVTHDLRRSAARNLTRGARRRRKQ